MITSLLIRPVLGKVTLAASPIPRNYSFARSGVLRYTQTHLAAASTQQGLVPRLFRL